jgi:cell division septation protein DedD
MASTTQDDGFHEIQLNGKQLVFLFMAVTVVSVVIFLLGVLVGRGVRAEGPAGEPLVAQQEPAQSVPEPPPAAATSSGGAPATASEDLSYPNRLASAEPTREQLNPATSAAAPAAAPPVPAPTPSTPPSAAPATGAASAPPAAPPAVVSKPAEPVAATPEPSGPGLTIQVAALAERAEADVIAKRLVGKGYPAYVMAPVAGAPPVFRVRVGKYKTANEAEAVAGRLQKEEQFKPWIVR